MKIYQPAPANQLIIMFVLPFQLGPLNRCAKLRQTRWSGRDSWVQMEQSTKVDHGMQFELRCKLSKS